MSAAAKRRRNADKPVPVRAWMDVKHSGNGVMQAGVEVDDPTWAADGRYIAVVDGTDEAAHEVARKLSELVEAANLRRGEGPYRAKGKR